MKCENVNFPCRNFHSHVGEKKPITCQNVPTHMRHYFHSRVAIFYFTCEYIEWEGNFSNSLTFPLFNHQLLRSELSRPSPFSLSLGSRRAKNNLEKSEKKKSKFPHTAPQLNLSNSTSPRKMCATRTVTHCHWNIFPFCCVIGRSCGPREGGRREGISKLWETIGLAFSFYNGAEPNKET